jgi:initiation factor 1A
MPRKNKGQRNNDHKPKGRVQMVFNDENLKPGQLYGTIENSLGSCHFEVKTVCNQTKRASLSGKIKKCSRVRLGDFVLLEQLSENEESKYQIVFKYTLAQKKLLERDGKLGVLIDSINQNGGFPADDTNLPEQEDEFVFEDPSASIHENTRVRDREAEELRHLKDLIDLM